MLRSGARTATGTLRFLHRTMSTASSSSAKLAPLTNVLSRAKSPYLLQHAKNPVAWQEWNDTTIDRAQQEDRMIFLSVGYSACHWCHVLAHESFEDDFTAKIMNDNFINIKVDREERPDVDRVYMTYLQATQGGGGWPLSVFLTPSLEPVFAGTYFPQGRFRSLLGKIAEMWEDDRESMAESGKQVMGQLRSMQENSSSSSASLATIAAQAPQKVYSRLLRGYDPVHGGFSKTGPKFPSPAQTLTLLSRYALYNSDEEQGAKAAEMGVRVLRALWEGGVRDWVGSGIARYSVDEKWRIPHFEKMLYDQGQVCSAALDFAQLPNLPNPASRSVCLDLAADIIEYTARDLRSPAGAFYSAEDADSAESFEHLHHTTEGAFYVWHKDEFDAVLGEEDAPIASMFFGVKLDGNVDPRHDVQGELTGKNTLFQAHSVEEVALKHSKTPDEVSGIVKRSISKVKKRRDESRPRPHLDDKVLTGWNGLMISALARASIVLPSDRHPIAGKTLSLAEDAIAFIRKELYDEERGELSRSWREGKGPLGQADDYAFLIKGLIDLYEAGGKEEHLVWAVRLQDKQDELFYDEEGGGYYASAPDKHILVRMKDAQDGAEPASTSVTLHNLQRLALYASARYEDFSHKAEQTYLSNSDMLVQAPHAFATSVAALMDHERGYRELIITGAPDDPFVRAIQEELAREYAPNRIVIRIDPRNPPRELAKLNPTIEDLIKEIKADDRPSLRVCENFACRLPVYDVDEAKAAIRARE